MKIKNDGKAIVKALNLDVGTLKHIGGFVFTAELYGAPITIHTEPIDEDYEYIKIKGYA